MGLLITVFFPSFLHSLPLSPPHPFTQPFNIFLITYTLSASGEGARSRRNPDSPRAALSTGTLSPSPHLWVSVLQQEDRRHQTTSWEGLTLPQSSPGDWWPLWAQLGLGEKQPRLPGRCPGWSSPLLGPQPTQPALPAGLLTLCFPVPRQEMSSEGKGLSGLQTYPRLRQEVGSRGGPSHICPLLSEKQCFLDSSPQQTSAQFSLWKALESVATPSCKKDWGKGAGKS